MFELFFQINFENIIIRHAKFDELINNSYYTIREYKLAINIITYINISFQNIHRSCHYTA